MGCSVPNLSIVVIATASTCNVLFSQTTKSAHSRDPILSEARWQEMDRSINRAYRWMAAQQAKDGSFPSHRIAQPAVTSLVLLAYLSGGHAPDEGRHAQVLQRG